MAATHSFAGRVLVTGANGSLGRALVQHLAAGGATVRALVRSERAAATLRALARPPELAIVDWSHAAGLARAAAGCDAAVHLVGILKETRSEPLRGRARAHRAARSRPPPRSGPAPHRVRQHPRRDAGFAQRLPRLEGRAPRRSCWRAAAPAADPARADGARRAATRRPGALRAPGARRARRAGARRRHARAADRRARRRRGDRRPRSRDPGSPAACSTSRAPSRSRTASSSQRAARVLGTRVAIAQRFRSRWSRPSPGWPSASRRIRRSRARCSACSSTTTRSTRSRRAARSASRSRRSTRRCARAARERRTRDDRTADPLRRSAPHRPRVWQRALPWLVTLVCFAYLYFQIDRQAARQGQIAHRPTRRASSAASTGCAGSR